MSDVSDVRPAAVTIVAWLMILSGAMGLISIPNSLRAINDPETRRQMEQMPAFREEFKKSLEIGTGPTIAAGMIAGLFIPLGISMLRGAAWSRTAYVVLCVFTYGFSLVIGTPLLFLAPSAAITLVVIAILYTKRPNEFFRAMAARH